MLQMFLRTVPIPVRMKNAISASGPSRQGIFSKKEFPTPHSNAHSFAMALCRGEDFKLFSPKPGMSPVEWVTCASSAVTGIADLMTSAYSNVSNG
jgi:hypothetical protein